MFVLIGNGIAYGLTYYFGVKKYAAFSGMFYILLPSIGMLYIIAFIGIATILNL